MYVCLCLDYAVLRYINFIFQLSDAISLELRTRRRIAKYRGEEVTYRASIDTSRLPQHLQDNSIVATIECVKQLFENLKDRCTEDLRPSDLIRICIQANGLDKPISTCLIPVSSLTVEKLMSTVMKVLQSKEEIKLDDGFTVDVITIRRDVGAGRRKLINVEIDRLEKRSIISVPTDNEGLCCAKSIVYALAYLENDRSTINALRDVRRPALVKRAKALHENAGVPLGPCTYEEIAIFEEYLDVQIVVISTQNMNKVSVLHLVLLNSHIYFFI